MTQKQIIRELAKSELAKFKQDDKVKRILFLRKRISKLRMVEPVTTSVNNKMKKYVDEYYKMRHHNKTTQKALILDSLI